MTIGAPGVKKLRSRRRRIALAATMLLVVSILAFLATEIFARLRYRPEELLVGEEAWIARWFALQEKRDDPSAEGMPLAPSDALHRPDAQLGWVPVERYSRDGVTTNSLGLRGAIEHPIERPDGVARIVAIGDSFTFGDGVRDDEVWTAKLASRLSAPVINLGVMGYGLDQQCLRLEQLGMRFHPDLVVVGLFGPDLDRDVLWFRDYAKPRFVLDGDGLALDHVPVPTPDELRSRIARPRVVSYAWSLLRSGADRLLERSGLTARRELARRLLDRIDGDVRAGGGRLVVAYFPAKPSSFSREPTDDENAVAEWGSRRQVPVVSIRPAFVALGPEQRRNVWHGHWTPFGNQVVADAVAAGLERLGLPAPRGR